MDKQNGYRFLLNSINSDITIIENIFITEYMPAANSAYVKVYLYGLMAARNPNALPASNETLAELFGMTVGDVINAWQYWKDQGILDVKITGRDLSEITFYNIGECLTNGKPLPVKPPKANVYNQAIENMFEQIQNMYGSRTVSRSDMSCFTSIMEDYDFSPEVVILLVEYSLNMLDKKGEGYNEGSARNYIKVVAKAWYEAGVRSFEDAERWQRENRDRTKYHYEILHALGIHRGVSDSERQTMDAWRNQFGFSRKMIDLAVNRAASPTVKYVNGILKSWYKKGWTDPDMVNAKDKAVSGKRKKGNQDVNYLSDEDRVLYEMRAQEDEDWFNSIEDQQDGGNE